MTWEARDGRQGAPKNAIYWITILLNAPKFYRLKTSRFFVGTFFATIELKISFENHQNKVQTALGRGLGICGFDYSRTRKQGKTENSEDKIQFKPNLSLKSGFWYSRTVIPQECNPSE